MVSAPKRSGFKIWPGQCVVFLGKMLSSRSTSLHPGREGHLARGEHSIQEGVDIFLVTSCHLETGRSLNLASQEARVQTLPLPLFQYTCLHILHTFATQGLQFRCMWVYGRVTIQGWVVQSWVKITQGLCEFDFRSEGFNSLTPMSDQDIISSYNINTISTT